MKGLFLFFKVLPPVLASSIGGAIGRNLGPRMATSRKARRNIRESFPQMSGDKLDQTIVQMWDNLGRVIAEYPHLHTLALKHTIIKNRHILEDELAKGKGAIFISAHQSNWEINVPAVYLQCDIPLEITYRAPNNPYVDQLLTNIRTVNGRLNAYPKSARSGRALIKALQSHRGIGFMIDQKYNEGMAIDFFGRPAMTNPVFAQLAQKFGCPLVPAQNIRTGKASFDLIIHEPIPTHTPDGTPRPIKDILEDAHTTLESWIEQEPAQWLWLHRRWDSKALKKETKNT